ncbi:Txe/YoeB family addiction module toxin [Clostridium sp.]|uniref:Txe/YoeB family addiction module toxin n=1 Tax=Clostridium sp. TaxID=1506 RepID=UPI002FDE9F2A
MGYIIKYSNYALKDARKLEKCGLDKKAKELLAIIKENPYQNPPPYEKLKGDLKRKVSRRINIQHRIVYQVLEEERIIKVYRMWTHYE